MLSRRLVFSARSLRSAAPRSGTTARRIPVRPFTSSALTCRASMAAVVDKLSSSQELVDEPALVPNSFFSRMILTIDVAVSKLFPGGFGWQAASIFAANSGFKSTELGFALMTGVGDCFGVSLGHLAISGIKTLISGKSFSAEIPTAVWLGAAAFCSGTVWQPTVNALAGLGLSFPAVFSGVWVVCGLAFFIGLRIGRIVLRNHGIAANNSHNLVEDAGLSVAIGGAGGMFVGTDITIPKNPFDSVFGVTPEMTPLQGCVAAGASTATGFTLAHSIQNTRASENGAFLTRGTFSKVSTVIGREIARIEPAASAGVKTFLDSKVNGLFDTIDANGDGRLTPQELIDAAKTK